MCIFENSMAVYFKFKSAKDYDSLSIDGHFISVGNLKDKIVEKKNLGRGTDFDLLISNAQTNEEYTDEAQLIPRNTSVLVRRVPGRRQRPIVTEVRAEKVNEDPTREQASPVQHVDGIAHMPLSKQVDESEWGDEFGVDLYTMPENPSLQHLPSQQLTPPQQLQPQLMDVDKLEEEDKIKAFVDASATDWQRQTQESLAAGKGFGRGGHGRGFGVRGGYGRSLGPEKKNPPPGYVCHRCGVAGHFIQHCPTNGDPAYDVKKMKPPTGIPKSMLVANADGSYALPSGEVAILRPNEAMFEKEVEGLPSNSRSMIDIPFELRCPLCSGVLRDAVLTSRCCFKSYCDECIRHQLMSNGKCVCGATNVLADDLLPNKTLREAIIRLLGTSTATSSAERPGSLFVQDMESAQRPKPRAPSPSGSQRSRPRAPSPSVSGSQKTGSVAAVPALTGKDSEIGNAALSLQKQQSLVVNIKHRRPEMLEQTADSISRQEGRSQGDIPGSQSNLNVEEEVQQENVTEAAKKRKLKPKRQKPVNGENNGYYRNAVAFDPLADGGMMSYPGNPALYGNYWQGPPQYIVDGYGQPILNPQYPMFGYGVPGFYGAGMMVPDPACVPAMPLFESSRDGMDHTGGGSSIMSREEFEARKAELRRKRELEQRSQNREDVTNAEIGDPGSSKVKRLSKSSNSIARSPLHDTNDAVEKDAYPTRRKMAATSLPPETVKRKRHERREESMSVDSRFERLNEDQRVSESIERPDKKPKGSVFSRISFPESKGTSKGLSSERLLESKDIKAEGGVIKGKRVSGISSQDSVKLTNGRKTNSKDDQLRFANRSISKSKMEEEEDDVANDDDAFERNFKHRTSYSSSPGDVSTRFGKRRQL